MSDSENTEEILHRMGKQKTNAPRGKISAPQEVEHPGSEKDFADNVKDVAYEILSAPMVQTKKNAFKEDLKQNKTIDHYLDHQLQTQLIKSCNHHIKFGVVYSYLFYKNFMSL